jgi:hypothetical protein
VQRKLQFYCLTTIGIIATFTHDKKQDGQRQAETNQFIFCAFRYPCLLSATDFNRSAVFLTV